MPLPHPIRALAMGLICLSAFAPVAMSIEKSMTGTVTGELTLNGQPVADGRIFFYIDDDQFVGSNIKNGEYKVMEVPIGPCRVEFHSDKIKTNPNFRVVIKPENNRFDFDVKGR